MSTENRSRTFFFGLLIAVAGGLLLLRSFDALQWELSYYLLSWPMLLIVVGVYNILSVQHRTSGFILLAIGGFFMLNKYFDFNISFWQAFWPLVLIIVGVVIILNSSRNRRIDFGLRSSNSPDDPISDIDVIDEITIFSGIEKAVTSKNFRGGKITSIFGGSEINLMQAGLSEGKNSIEMVAIFGGATLIVPPDWDVKVDVTAVFGGFTDKRYKRTDINTNPDKTLVIHGAVIFGGGEIKSY
jgi:predicted membrane protein